jgi:hypothetical protein
MQKKDELYNKSIQQFISILTNIKLQMRLNPEKAEENIDEVIILLRNQIIIPEVKASPPKQKSSKEVKVEKIPAVEEPKVSVALPVVAESLVIAPVTEELFVSADKIKEAEEA